MRVVVGASEYLTYSESAQEEYGSWTEDWDFSVDKVFKADEDYKTHYSEDGYLVQDGDKAYVITMRYDTGDSFGNASGRGTVIHVFGSKDVAQAAFKALEDNQDCDTIKVTDDFGREINMSNPGAGYFETITSIDLEEYSV